MCDIVYRFCFHIVQTIYSFLNQNSFNGSNKERDFVFFLRFIIPVFPLRLLVQPLLTTRTGVYKRVLFLIFFPLVEHDEYKSDFR